MKILIPSGIYPPDIGGPATYVPKIAKRMLQDDVSPTIIAYSHVESDKKYDSLGFPVIRIKRSFFFLFHYIKYFFAVLKHAKNNDIIYLQDYFSAGIPTILANFFRKKPLVIKVVGIFSWEQAQNRKFTKDILDLYVKKRQNIFLEGIKKVELFLLSKANTIIVPSYYMKNLLIQFGIPENKIEVIYNSFEYFPYQKLDTSKKRQEMQKYGSKVYISVGRLVEWKNFDMLIRKFQSIDGTLYIIGEGLLKEKLSQIIKETKQENKIFLTGALGKEKLYEYYQGADVFVLISSYEGMSHTLIEAISMNLFIISSDIDPNTETLERYSRKKIVPLDSVSLDFSDKTEKENVEYILEKFDFEKLYSRLLTSLKDVYTK